MLFHREQAIENLCSLLKERTDSSCASVLKASDLQIVGSEADTEILLNGKTGIENVLGHSCTTCLVIPIPQCKKGKQKKVLVLKKLVQETWSDDHINYAQNTAEFISMALTVNGSEESDTEKIDLNVGEIQNLSAEIAEIFNKYRKLPSKNNDLWFNEGRKRFKNLVNYYIIRGLPVPFVLPAFPFKSRNHETKVTGPLPDKGEKLALVTLANFCTEVKKVYAAGAELIVISDGYVFNDIYEISDEVTEEYRTNLLEMERSGVLKFLGFDDFFLPLQSYDKKRQKLMDCFGESKEIVQTRIGNDPAQKAIYCGMKKFMEDEFQCCQAEFGQRTKAVKRVKTKCRQMMLRNEAYGRLIAAFFPNHIRLSIHPHSNLHKYGINVIHGAEGNCGSPWHNVAVYHAENDMWETMKKSKAIDNGYIETKDEEGFVYYHDGADRA